MGGSRKRAAGADGLHRRLRSIEPRPPPILVGDAIGLDFLNSIATPVDVPVDWIEDGEGYLRWLGEAKLVPADVLREIGKRVSPGELDRVAMEARRLREWFRVFVRRHQGRPLQRHALTELKPLNRLLERDEVFGRLSLRPAGRVPFELRTVRRWRDPAALLSPVAEALARLVSSEDFAYVKACEGPACTLLFADHTRGHLRRWCRMAVCGNRAKQAAHRRRARTRRRSAA